MLESLWVFLGGVGEREEVPDRKKRGKQEERVRVVQEGAWESDLCPTGHREEHGGCVCESRECFAARVVAWAEDLAVRVACEKRLDNCETKPLPHVPVHGVDWRVFVLLRVGDNGDNKEHSREEHGLHEVAGALREDKREEARDDDEQERRSKVVREVESREEERERVDSKEVKDRCGGKKADTARPDCVERANHPYEFAVGGRVAVEKVCYGRGCKEVV